MRLLDVLARASVLLLGLITVSLTPAFAQKAKVQPYEHFVFGKLNAATPGPVSGGLLLMGGGDRNIDAMKWFFGKAGRGHIVVISASYGKEIGQEFFHDIGGIASTEIFVFHDRSQATNRKILDRLKKADGIFIAGGDQARYVRFWRGTPVEDILNAHVASGKPIAGTSAGLAILGERAGRRLFRQGHPRLRRHHQPLHHPDRDQGRAEERRRASRPRQAGQSGSAARRGRQGDLVRS